MDYTLRGIPDELWRKAKSFAALDGLSMKDLLLQLLATYNSVQSKDNDDDE